MYEHINVLYIYFYLLFRICNLSTGKQTESASENKVTEQFSTAGIYIHCYWKNQSYYHYRLAVSKKILF